MKAALTLAAALAAPLACAADKPGIDAFFDAMAIRVAPGQQKQFVVGDNVAGYGTPATVAKRIGRRILRYRC